LFLFFIFYFSFSLFWQLGKRTERNIKGLDWPYRKKEDQTDDVIMHLYWLHSANPTRITISEYIIRKRLRMHWIFLHGFIFLRTIFLAHLDSHGNKKTDLIWKKDMGKRSLCFEIKNQQSLYLEGQNHVVHMKACGILISLGKRIR
jgi:hypothetical protein